MSPEAIQAEQNQHQSMVLSHSPTTPTPTATSAPPLPPRTRTDSGGGGWAASKFLKNVNLSSLGGSTSGPSTPRSSTPVGRNSLDSPTVVTTPPNAIIRQPSPPPPTSLQTVIHAFRIPLANKNAPSANNTGDGTGAESYGPPYPLCHTGWCVSRLRTTCELWGYVNRGVLERVWREARTLDLRLRVEDVSPTGEPPGDGLGRLREPSPTPAKRKAPTFWDMGKNVFDKARGASPISGPSPSDGSKSTLFSGIRRSVSGGRNTGVNGVPMGDGFGPDEGTRPSAPAPQRVSSDADSAKLDLGDDASEADTQDYQQETIKRSSSDSGKRGIARLSALFITPNPVEEKDRAGEKANGDAEQAQQSVVSAQPAGGSNTVKEEEEKRGAELEVPTSLELDTVTPHARTFRESQEFKRDAREPANSDHDAATVQSNDTSTNPAPLEAAPDPVQAPDGPRPDPLPSIEVKRAGTPPPSVPKPAVTPGKTVPPPVPRRAAARNAPGRGSIVAIPKEPEPVRKEAPTEPSTETATSSDTKGAATTEVTNDDSKLVVPPESNEAMPVSLAAVTVVPPASQPEEAKLSQDQDATIVDANHSNVSTPKSISAPLPPIEMPSPSRHPVPHLPAFLEKEDGTVEETKSGRPRQPSVVSSSSDYTQSVYTTDSAAPMLGDEAPPVPDKEDVVHGFYVGRSTWEDRAWLELVRIRERMFWARLGGVVHSS